MALPVNNSGSTVDVPALLVSMDPSTTVHFQRKVAALSKYLSPLELLSTAMEAVNVRSTNKWLTRAVGRGKFFTFVLFQARAAEKH